MTDYTPLELIHDIETHGVGVTDWEKGFVDSMSTKLGRDGKISPDQLAKLQEIHEDRVG